MRFERISINPAQMGGVPCIRGLRIPVATVVGLVAQGMPDTRIVEEYPDLEIEDVRQSLRFAAAAVGLSAEERAALAGQLIESLDQPIDDDAEAAWSVEIQRRLQRLDDGIAKTVPGPEARRRILAATDRDAGT